MVNKSVRIFMVIKKWFFLNKWECINYKLGIFVVIRKIVVCDKVGIKGRVGLFDFIWIYFFCVWLFCFFYFSVIVMVILMRLFFFILL